MESVTELKAKRERLASEARTLCELDSITAGQEAHLDRLLKGIDKLDAQITEIRNNARQSVTHRDRGYDEAPQFLKRTTRAEVFQTDSHDLRTKADMAKRAIDVVQEDTGLEVRSEVAHHVALDGNYADTFRASADPAYARALSKILVHGESAALLKMTDEERASVARVASVEARTMSTSDSQGGYMLSAQIDPQILVNSTGTAAGLRSVARVVTATTDVWRGIYSAGIAADWVPELTEVGDNSPTLGSQEIQTHKAASFVGPISFEIEQDSEALITQLQALLADSRMELENEAFINGNGTNKPKGLIYMLEQNASSKVVGTTAGALGAVDIYNLMAALPPRFRGQSAFMASLTTLNKVRAVSDDRLGNYITDLRNGYSFQLLGRPVYESNEMDAFVATGSTTNATFMVVGDFSKAYTIVDRLGAGRVSVIPHMFGTTNNRPIGASGLYYHWRVGGSVLTNSTSGECGARILVNKTS